MIQPLSGRTFSDALRAAINRFESGLYEQAGQQVLAVLQDNPADEDALYLLRLVERRLAHRKPTAKPTLIWQFDPKGAWESDWLHMLLGGSIKASVVDTPGRTCPRQ